MFFVAEITRSWNHSIMSKCIFVFVVCNFVNLFQFIRFGQFANLKLDILLQKEYTIEQSFGCYSHFKSMLKCETEDTV